MPQAKGWAFAIPADDLRRASRRSSSRVVTYGVHIGVRIEDEVDIEARIAMIARTERLAEMKPEAERSQVSTAAVLPSVPNAIYSNGHLAGMRPEAERSQVSIAAIVPPRPNAIFSSGRLTELQNILIEHEVPLNVARQGYLRLWFPNWPNWPSRDTRCSPCLRR